MSTFFPFSMTLKLLAPPFSAPSWPAPKHEHLLPHTDAAVTPLMNEYQQKVAADFVASGSEWLHEVPDNQIGFINFLGQYCEYAVTAGDAFPAETRTAKNVVAVVLKKDESDGEYRVLTHRHKEPASSWGFEQEFVSYPAGRVDNPESAYAQLNTALNEAYEESNGLALDGIEIKGARLDPKMSVLTVYMIVTGNIIETPLEDRKSQFYPFATKVPGSAQKAAKPRQRGDYDSAGVEWCKLDLSKEVFVRCECGEENKGRFNCFANPEIAADLRVVLGL